MKVNCSACAREEARVFCCADEAALCLGCDEKIHPADKSVSKHQRVSLSSTSSSSPRPKCDICQDAIGCFLCLEDRALLCRKCDVAIHTMNSIVSGHQRFLLTGAKVGLESTVSADIMRVAGLAQVAAPSKDGDPVVMEGKSHGATVSAAITGTITPSSQGVLSKAEGKYPWQFGMVENASFN